MDTCTIETGLLRKHPCGEKAVTKCANCEQALCAKHTVATMSAGKKTMLCPECAKAWKQQEKTMGTVPSTPATAPAAKKPAEAPKAAAPKPAAPKPAPSAPKPAAAPAAAGKKPDLSIEHSGSMDFKPAAGAAPKPAPKPAAAAPKAEDSGLDKKPELSIDDTGTLEFTPSKKPEEKK
jgi:hypothetical protein